MLSIIREIGAQIIHAPVVLKPSGELNTVGWDPHRYSELKDLFQDGTWNAEFAPELIPSLSGPNGDIVLSNRRSYDAFEGTELKSLLKNKEVTNLFVCGFLTNVCVSETALSASTRLTGVNIYVVED